MMTRRGELESKLKIALLELKTTKDINNDLLKELDDHEIDMSSMLAKHNDLKNQLSEQDIVFEDMRDQRDRLQCTLDSYQHDQELYELALRSIKNLEQELNLNKCKLEELELRCICKKQADNTINTMDLYSELIQATPNTEKNTSLPFIDLMTPKFVENKNKICMRSSNKLKKYVKVKKIIKRFSLMSKKYKMYFKNANICKQKLDLNIELDECYNLLGRNNREIDYLSNRMTCLQKSLNDLSRKYELSNKQNKAHIAATASLVALNTISSCHICSSEVPDVPMPCPVLSVNATEVYIAHTSPEHLTPVPEPLLDHPVPELIMSSLLEPLLAHSDSECKKIATSQELSLHLAAPASGVDAGGLTKSSESTNRTVVYSDEVGVGMGSLLKNCLAQPICNNSYRNMPFKELLLKIKNVVHDDKTTIIVQLGNSLGIKKSNIISLVETLLDIQSTGINKIITCSFPYSNKMTANENAHVYELNLTLYNLTCRHSDFLYFESNNYISKFILTKDTLYLSKYEKMTIAKLLAFNIHDPVINSIMGHSDTARTSQAISRMTKSVNLN